MIKGIAKSRNIFPPPASAINGKINDVTYNVSTDGIVTLSGTATATTTINVNLKNHFIVPTSSGKGGHGTVAFNNTVCIGVSVIFVGNGENIDEWSMNSANRVHTSYSIISEKELDSYIIRISSGTNCNNFTCAIAFSNDDVPVSPYEPYGGIPKDITRITMKGKNLFDVSTVEKGRIDNGDVGYTSQTSSLTIEGATVSFTTTATYRGVCSGFFEIPETGNLWFNFTTNKTLGVKFVFYDSSKTWLNADYIHTLTDPFPAMATIPTGAKYVRMSFTGQITGGSDYTMSDIMLNLGSTALPYEPYGYQEGWEVRDNQDRLIWGREDELQTATGTLPFKGYALPVKVKSLLGNAVQNGTPAPDNIIIPEMCGVRTGNLLNLNRTYSSLFTTDTTKWMNGAVTMNNGGTSYAETEILGDVIKVTSKSNGYGASFLIEASPNTTYTVSFEADKASSGSWGGISDRDINGTVISNSAIHGKSATFTTHSDCAFLNVCFRFPPADGTVTFSKIMLNSGSTALPYEPYGWAIEIEVI